MSAMTVTMTSGEGIRKERSPRGRGEEGRRSGQARVALEVATNLAKRSTGCWIAYFVAWLLCAFDALGVESYVPQSAQVKSVKVSLQSLAQNTSFSSREGVEGICRAHEQLLGLEDGARNSGADYSSGSVTVGFTYTLEDGRTCKRSHTIPTKGKNEKAVLSALMASCNSREGIDSRLAVLMRANSRHKLEIDYDSYDDEDQVYYFNSKQVTEFISGPLAKDARQHGALDIDLADPSGAYQVGKLGAVDVNLSDDEDDTVWTVSVPVSRKGTPAICAWLAENMQQ